MFVHLDEYKVKKGPVKDVTEKKIIQKSPVADVFNEVLRYAGKGMDQVPPFLCNSHAMRTL